MAAKRKPPVRIPIPVETFVEGLLQIDPKKLASRKKAAKKRAKGKSNRNNQAS